MAAAAVPCATTAAGDATCIAVTVVGVAAGAMVAAGTCAPLSELASTWRSTISAAFRNRPEFWNACLMSLPVRPRSRQVQQAVAQVLTQRTSLDRGLTGNDIK